MPLGVSANWFAISTLTGTILTSVHTVGPQASGRRERFQRCQAWLAYSVCCHIELEVEETSLEAFKTRNRYALGSTSRYG